MSEKPFWPYTGIGCDAIHGGPHTPVKQGNYIFCSRCGETIKLRRTKVQNATALGRTAIKQESDDA